MRKISYIILSALALCSCEKFLDQKPQADVTRPSTEVSELVSAYSSAADAQSELSGAYALMKADIYEACQFYLNECMTDNCYIGGDGVAEEQLGNAALTATNKQIAIMWQQYYAVCGAATNVIENVKLMPEDAIEASERARLIAEASFVRAWIYFDIVRLWGAAPMTLDLIPSITVDNLDQWYPVMYPGRTSEEEIYAQILADLSDDNIAALPSKSNGAFQGTKGAAYGLLAKVYATMGEKSSRDYAKVEALCQKVEDEGYALVPNFDDLWTVPGKFSSEGIFEILFTTEAEQHNWAYWILLTDTPGTVTVSWRRYCCPSHELVAKFDKEKDVRYASSIIWASAPYATYYPAGNYPFAYKIRQKDNNIILMRLADILLLKAEALVEQNRVGDAIEIVNTIRQRAGLSALSKSMSQGDARLAVENERQLELFLEGHRFYDLARNGRWEEVAGAAKDKNGNPRFKHTESFRTRLPIPQEQIDINERLTQNIGY